MSQGERAFFAVATSVLTMLGMVILLVVVIGTFYLLVDYITEKIRLKIEQKAEADEPAQKHPEVRHPEQPDASDGGGGSRSNHDFCLDGQGLLSGRETDR